jgi:hypothetical protein
MENKKYTNATEQDRPLGNGEISSKVILEDRGILSESIHNSPANSIRLVTTRRAGSLPGG